MALKPDRIESHTDISHFMNETAERGVIVVHVTTTSGVGAAMDDADSVVQLPNNVGGSGESPAGLLLNDVVNLDLTRQHINWHQDEMQIGGKVTVLKQGQITTNMVEAGVNPVPGAKCYFTTDGNLTSTATTGSLGADVVTQVGRFLTTRDSDGYLRVEINIT
jgi:hypothetical protein